MISGDTSGSVTEDGTLSASGSLSVTDADSEEGVFTVQTDVATTYGSFSIDAAGAWTYSLNNSNAAVQGLGDGDILTDSITVASADGTEQEIEISITGTNDAAEFEGDTAGAIDEDSRQGLPGRMRVTDVDGENAFTARTNVETTYGSFSITAGGEWIYSLNNGNANVQALGVGDSVTETIVVAAVDGTTQDIRITINGTNDAPVLQGDPEKSFSLNERDVSTGYTPIANDLDADELTAYTATGPDAHLFTIDKVTGELVFVRAPDFENPLGSEGGVDGAPGNTYVVEISAIDPFGEFDTEIVRINVQDVNEPNPVAHFVSGPNVGSFAGQSMSILGDVNGDGVGDYLISAPGIETSYVVFGTDAVAGDLSSEVDLDALASGGGVNGFVLTGAAVTSVAAGDIDGDGLNDIVLGAPTARSNAGDSAGKTFVLYGKDTFDDRQALVNPFNASINLALDVTAAGDPLGFVLEGASIGARSGFGVAAMDNDFGTGPGQLLISAPFWITGNPGDSFFAFTGRTYVIQGQAGDGRLYGSYSLADVGASGGLSGFYDYWSVDFGLRFAGTSVSAAGDVNNDSLSDIVFTAFDASDGSLAVVALFGQSPAPSGPVDIADYITNPSVLITGFQTTFDSGDIEDHAQLVSIIGDINGDGVDDLVVGDPVAIATDGSFGRSYVIYGRDQSGYDSPVSYGIDITDLLLPSGSNLGFIIEGSLGDGSLGYSVGAAGDVNGDGVDDLIVTAPGATVEGQDVGAAFVIFGQQEGFERVFDLGNLDGTNGFVIYGGDTDVDFGTSVMTQPGDINNDGYDDIILGAREWYDQEEESIGGAHIIYGQALFDSTVTLDSVL